MELSDSCRDAAMYSSTVGGRSCMKQGMLKVSSAILSAFGGETAAWRTSRWPNETMVGFRSRAKSADDVNQLVSRNASRQNEM